MFDRMADSLAGFCLNMRQKPVIRYILDSPASEKLADKVD